MLKAIRIHTRNLFLVPLLVCMASCTLFSKKQNLVVGYIDAFSGTRAMFGVSTRSGIQMAIDELNAQGGLRGQKIDLKIYDDEGIPQKAEKVAGQLLKEHPNVLAVLGASASSRSLLMAPIFQKQEIPMVTSSSTHPKVTAAGDYIFRVCFVDTFQGPVMAEFLIKSLKIKKAAILRDISTQYSLTLSEFFKKRFIRTGGEVVSDQTYQSGDVDFGSQLKALKKHRPQVVYVPGYYSDVGRIVLQARQEGIASMFVGGDGWDSPDLLNVVEDRLNGAYFTSHFSPDNEDPTYLLFKKNYVARYGRPPDAFSALGYDAAGVLIAGMKKTKTLSPSGIRDEIAKTKNYSGVTGKISLDKNRNAIKPVVILKIEDKKIKIVTSITP
ncbi:MAG: ABC transporter substrate-binding protein [Bdellovibrionales bacterium]|nr:ABC transporter substrate-binding protein [Bdellovibrionales bacterium]